MSLRRFVYLITADKNRRDFLLRRIDTPSLFFPAKGDRPAHPPPLEEARLPRPVIRFNAAARDPGDGNMEFMLFSGGGRKRDTVVVATDPEGRAVLVDPDRRAVRLLPDLTKPKTGPISFTIGSVLYILGTMPRQGILRTLCFDCLVFNEHGHDGWCGRLSLPAPPYETTWTWRGYDSFEETTANVTASALVPGVGGGTILVSKRTLGTHAFDVASGAWSKTGDWALPFYGRAHLVPEHGVWLGLSSLRGGDGRVPRDCDDGLLCASDLTDTAAPPTPPRDLWRDPTPPGWASRESYFVGLGCSRFCLARFFESRRPDGEVQRFVVFTGIEVERAGGDGELCVVKHRSRRYNHDGDHKAQRVL